MSGICWGLPIGEEWILVHALVYDGFTGEEVAETRLSRWTQRADEYVNPERIAKISG